jgi:maltose-binding protein MalE
MKKISLFSLVVFSALSITSCKKDRTCTCTTTTASSAPSYTPNNSSDVITISNSKKNNAEVLCGAGTSTTTGTYTDYSVFPSVDYPETRTQTCTLK